MSLFSSANLRSPGPLARFLLTAAIALSLDLWSKHYAFDVLVSSLKVHPDGNVSIFTRPPHKFIPGLLHFEATVNRGAVFGMGQGMGVVFVSVSVAAIAFLFYLFATSGKQRFYQVILGMLLAGVLGNMYDRLRLGYVRDMIHMIIGADWFPWIFNVADVLLCTGVAMMVLHSLFGNTPETPTTPATDKP